jgi:hypothetical protein
MWIKKPWIRQERIKARRQRRSARSCRSTGLTKAREDAFKAVEDYRHQLNLSTEQLLHLLNDDSSKSHKALKENVSKLSEICAAHETMATKLAELLKVETIRVGLTNDTRHDGN